MSKVNLVQSRTARDGQFTSSIIKTVVERGWDVLGISARKPPRSGLPRKADHQPGKEIFSEVRSAENEYENGNLKKENEYDTQINILRKIFYGSRKYVCVPEFCQNAF